MGPTQILTEPTSRVGYHTGPPPFDHRNRRGSAASEKKVYISAHRFTAYPLVRDIYWRPWVGAEVRTIGKATVG